MVLEKGRFVFESLCLGKMTKHQQELTHLSLALATFDMLKVAMNPIRSALAETPKDSRKFM